MSTRSHIPTALTVAALAVAALPAAAEAATTKLVTYEVEADVTLVHDHAYSFSTSWEKADTSTELVSELHTKLGRLTFRDGLLVTGLTSGPATADSSGVAKGTYVNKVFSGSRLCNPKPGPQPSGQGSIEEEMLTPLTGEALNLRIADDVNVDWTCTGDERVSASPSYAMTDNSAALGSGPLDAAFEIPRDAMGYGKIIQRIQGPGRGFCAGAELAHTTECLYRWTGEVELTKVGEATIPTGSQEPQVDDSLLAPLVPPAGKAPAPDLDDLLVPLVPASAAKADAKGSTVSFTASCPSGCAGTAGLSVGAAKASARKPAATMRFSVKAGKPRTVKLRLPKKAARALRRTGKGRLAVTLKPKKGKSVKRTIAVKVAKRR